MKFSELLELQYTDPEKCKEYTHRVKKELTNVHPSIILNYIKGLIDVLGIDSWAKDEVKKYHGRIIGYDDNGLFDDFKMDFVVENKEEEGRKRYYFNIVLNISGLVIRCGEHRDEMISYIDIDDVESLLTVFNNFNEINELNKTFRNERVEKE